VSLGFLATPAFAQDEGQKPTDEKKVPDGGNQPGPGGPGGRGGRGGPGGRFRLPIDEYKKELNLSDEQVKKLEDINDEMIEDFRKGQKEMQESGDFDPTKIREKMQEGRKKIREKISGILNDEQKQKFADMMKKEDERMARGPRFGPDPERMKKTLYEQAEKELTLSPDEKAAVMPLVQKLLDVRAEVRTAGEKRREDFKQYVRKADGSTDAQKAEIAAKLAEYRKAVESDKKRVKDAEQALREVLTVDNEAKLVGIGVLLAE
jgi:hypothetical protein